MSFNPTLNKERFEAAFTVVDSHTVGEFTRIVLSGFPKLEGNTMMERKNFLVNHCDHYRTALMLEPRGHHDMFGAIRSSALLYLPSQSAKKLILELSLWIQADI